MKDSVTHKESRKAGAEDPPSEAQRERRNVEFRVTKSESMTKPEWRKGNGLSLTLAPSPRGRGRELARCLAGSDATGVRDSIFEGESWRRCLRSCGVMGFQGQVWDFRDSLLVCDELRLVICVFGGAGDGDVRVNEFVCRVHASEE